MKTLRIIVCGVAVLLIPVLMIGCSNKPESPASDAATVAPKTEESKSEGHSHGSGPHGGTVADWGGGAYHVEFTVDHDKKEATVYVLGSDGKTPAPLKASKIRLIINDPSTELELVAKPLDGESAGASSRFAGTHDNIGIVKEFDGTISGEVDGTPYVGDFKEESEGPAHK